MDIRHTKALLWNLGLVLLVAFSFAPTAEAQIAPQVDVLTVKGAITPIVASYVDRGITTAESDGSACLIIELDTPGGSVQVTEEIVQHMKAAAVPIVVYVHPSGAKAASAGTFLTLAAHLAAMAPGTRIGAAHPVDMSGQEMSEAVEAKSVNDAVALIKGLAEPRGPEAVAWAESAVRESSSITDDEALERGVVDLVAKDLPTLVLELDGREVVVNDQTVTLVTQGARINQLPMSAIEGFLHTITDPNIAFLLMTIGLNAIIFELSQPGGYLSGVVGAICLVLALFSLGVLSVNWTGLIFVALAFVLLIADVKAPTHGILTALGVVSFILGSMILFSSPFAQVSLHLVVAVGLFTGVFFAFVIAKVLGIHRRRPITGIEGLVGQLAVARSDLDPEGTVFLKGELWQAVVSEGSVRRGEQVEITEVSGFKLRVRKVTREPAPK
ncbi:MAG TPA: nodulation protein NfeD [Anaerolineae bacterium]|nr:nodulation protein NfeD [Anaerolineae bacterium]